MFSQLCDDIWRGLPGFAFRSSVRTWLYVLARHALCRFRRSPWNRDRRTGSAAIDALVASHRSRTAPWQRTDVKTRFRALRETLDPDDQTLLVLRVDRELPWRDIAAVFADEGTERTPTELAREAARLRKRFQLIKDDLTRRAIEAGIVAPRDTP